MIVPFHLLVEKYNLDNIKGILHIGAHELEEKKYYDIFNINNVVWVDAIQEKVDQMKQKYPDENIICATISDKDNEEVEFIVTNNFQSSSFLELDLHKKFYPHILEKSRFKTKTTSIKTLAETHPEIKNCNFINLDIQGTELKALQGMSELLDKVDYIYTEVNVANLYKDCGMMWDIDRYLFNKGFVRFDTHITEQLWGDAFYYKMV
jgi:FkbM family methyltransferase